jgi:secondary thiamine-phosphate synthase enzyme
MIMKIKKLKIKLKTEKQSAIRDLTSVIEEFVQKSKILNGLINIQSLHTTAAVFVNEKESGLLKDMIHHLEEIVPRKNKCVHDDFAIRTENLCEDECANGHSHLKAIHLPTSITLNIINGKIQFGRWQRILFIELDRSRDREISLLAIGE